MESRRSLLITKTCMFSLQAEALLVDAACPTQIRYSIVLNVLDISANQYPQNEVCCPEKRCINSKSALQ